MLYEFDNTKDAVINPNNIVDRIDNIPKVGVACFSKDLFEKIVSGSKSSVIGKLSNTNGEKLVYEMEYKGKKGGIIIIAL